MIRVTLSPVPRNFDARVRIPGATFLAATPRPTGAQWTGNDYWRLAHSDLYAAYHGICSYCASWTHRSQRSGLDSTSVDHFVARANDANLAYEWSNMRLCRRRLNRRKSSHMDVTDPLTVGQRWFRLDFRTFLLRPDPSLAPADQASVASTIARLGLNSDRDYVDERVAVIRQYCRSGLTRDQVRRRYPFIAAEMRSQNFDRNFLPQLSALFARYP